MDNEKNAVLEEVKSLGKTIEERITRIEGDYKSEMKDLRETIEAHKGDKAIDKEELKSAVEDVLNLQQQEFNRTLELPGGGMRTTDATPDVWKDGYEAIFEGGSIKEYLGMGTKGLEMMNQIGPINDDHLNFQKMCLDRWLLDSIARVTSASKGLHYEGYRKTFPKMDAVFWKFVTGMSAKLASDAMDTTDMSDWVPTGWSTQLRELVTAQLRVAALFPRINMPQSPFTLPVDLTDQRASRVIETTDLQDPTDDVVMQTLTPGYATFTAHKLRSRFITSREFVEDAMVAILPLIRRRLVSCLANAQEDATLNSDSAVPASHQDYDTATAADASDCRHTWLGLRIFCYDNSWATDVSLADPFSDAFLTVRKGMGDMAIDIDQIAYIVGLSDYIDLIGDENVATVDKYGPSAGILRGELAKVYGAPVIVSRYVRENVNDSGYNENGGTNTYSTITAVNRMGWMYGDRRNISIETGRMIAEDQDQLVSFQRLDFQNIQGTSYPAAWIGTKVTP